MSVLSPAVDWILQCLVHRGDHLNYTMQLVSNVPPLYVLRNLKYTMRNFRAKETSRYDRFFYIFSWRSVLTSSVLNTFPPSFIGDECVNIIEMCISLETNVSEILKNLGLCLSLVEMQTSQAKDVWVKVWPEIKKIPNREAYLNCCQVWIEFVVKFFGVIAY